MVLGKLSVPSRPTNMDNCRGRAIVLEVGTGVCVGGGCLHSHFSSATLQDSI